MEQIITSVLTRTLIAGTPLLLGTVGEIISERGGVMNLGVEGMMAVGAVSGFAVTYTTGNPWLGLAFSMICGALFALIHAFVSISLRANQVVSGLALSMLGLGISGLWGKPYIGKPLAIKMEAVNLPYLRDIPYIGEIFFRQDPYFYLSIILGAGAWFFLYRTKLGIVVRSTGENPRAAETQGINVHLVQYLCVMAGGAFAGLAGSHLSIAYSKSWIEGLTAGRGWIVIALTIFSMWDPKRAFTGAYVFGGIFVLQYLLQPLGISPNFLAMLPYLTTLAVLVFYGLSLEGHRKMHAPAHLGEPYKRGER
ncbi:MAG: ABC transporter permease [Spirochaetales bacterium]|nr:ABC transporter permease [Spirochaetales bacterium]